MTVCRQEAENTVLSADLFLGDQHFTAENTLPNRHAEYEKECERLLAVALYDCFVRASGYVPPWGILTGVRPAKLYARLAAQGEEAANRWFCEALKVQRHKIDLCRDTVRGENAVTALSRPDSFSLYLSVPFCPSRCSYCSFVSHSIDRAKGLIPQYVALLCEELRQTAAIAKQCALRLETVYIGGGTPTSLTAEQIALLMQTVREGFDCSFLREFTVEAGRPDTVTKEKLLAIRDNGGTRISINPQTMNDAVLQEIGRRHTAAQTEEAFALARACGFRNINMDLIAGLPGDTPAGFRETLRRVLALDPECVTVHSLAMKRASALSTGGRFPEAEAGAAAEEMVEYARAKLAEAGFSPYYMYRQSKTVGNLENVGYAKPGFEGLYNVFTMDETHTVLACGASAVSKLRQPGGAYIERIFNYKYPYEYIDRHAELMKRKAGIVDFYRRYGLAEKKES